MLDHRELPPLQIPPLLDKYGIRPSKGLGQNFLVDQNSLRKVVEVAEISVRDVVLEVGPGLGSLTRYLASAAGQVIAVELDEKLLPALHETLASFSNVKIILGDILELDPKNLLTRWLPTTGQELQQSFDIRFPTYKVVANIPYYITSALIRHLLEAEVQPGILVLTLQKEVAQRICQSPPKMSLLALSVQVYGKPTIAAKISAGAFYPPPKVDSAVVKIDLYPAPVISQHLIPVFFQLAKAGFGQKRKMLRNTLSAGMSWSKEQAEFVLAAADIDPQRRAQTLSLEEWRRLTNQATSML